MRAVTKQKDRAAMREVRSCGMVAGTRIMTARGPTAVDAMRVGDPVTVMLFDGPHEERVSWIGRRTMILSRNNRQECPVRFRVDAVADGVPTRDVYLAPDHAIYLEGKLYMARDLVNGGSILREGAWKSVSYYGFSLDRHNVVLAENLMVETLLPSNADSFTVVKAERDRAPANEAAADTYPDVRTTLLSVLGMLKPRMSELNVRVDFAVLPHLRVRLPEAAFRGILLDMMNQLIVVTPTQRLLVAARRQGTQVVISVTSEFPLDSLTLEANLRDVQSSAAMLSATLRVTADRSSAVSVSLTAVGG